MVMQLTELTEQLVTICHNLDPKRGVMPDSNELEATRLALSQLSEVASAFIKTQADRFQRGFFLPIRVEIEELFVDMTYLWPDYSHRLFAVSPPPEGHAMKLGAVKDVLLKMDEKLAELNSRLAEYDTLCAEIERFYTGFYGAWEQVMHQADQPCNEV